MSEFDILRKITIKCIPDDYGKDGMCVQGLRGDIGDIGPIGATGAIGDTSYSKSTNVKSDKYKLPEHLVLHLRPENAEDMEKLNTLLIKVAYCINNKSRLGMVAKKERLDYYVDVKEDDELYPLIRERELVNPILSKTQELFIEKLEKLEEEYERTINNIVGITSEGLQKYLNSRSKYLNKKNVFTDYEFRNINRKLQKIQYSNAIVYCMKGSVIYDKLVEMGILESVYKNYVDNN